MCINTLVVVSCVSLLPNTVMYVHRSEEMLLEVCLRLFRVSVRNTPVHNTNTAQSSIMCLLERTVKER